MWVLRKGAKEAERMHKKLSYAPFVFNLGVFA